MPNVDKTKSELGKWQRAECALRKGEAIEIDDKLLLPSMADGDTESDLATCERMVKRLKFQLQEARKQSARKSVETGEDGFTALATGAHRVMSDLSVDMEEIPKIVPTGEGGRISRRDVRVYAANKAAGTLEAYYERALTRTTANLPKSVDEALKELKRLASPYVSTEVDEDAAEKAKEDEPKALTGATAKPAAKRKPRTTKRKPKEPVKSDEPKGVNPLA